MALNPVGDGSVGWSPIRRILFETAIGRWIVGRRDHNPVLNVLGAIPVVSQDRPGDNRRRREAIVSLDKSFHPVRCKYFKRHAVSRSRKSVSIFAHEERPADSMALAIRADGLSDGQDMSLGERAIRGGAAVPACAEATS